MSEQQPPAPTPAQPKTAPPPVNHVVAVPTGSLTGKGT
jgi:hypothetical protein